jgi:flagellar protein FliO/FliZ
LSLDLYTRFAVAVIAILALLAAFAWLVRRYGVGGRPVSGAKRRLAIVEVAPLDSKRRLILLRRDQTEHLVLLGPDSALLIESGVTAPPPPSSPPSSSASAEPSFAALIDRPLP